MNDKTAPTAYVPPPIPKIREITRDEVSAALRAGVEDFRKAPLFGLFFGGIYALGGFAVLEILIFLQSAWMIIPFAIGFPLIGPFVAVGLYEVSRRRKSGEPLVWSDILLVMRQQTNRQLGWMSLVVLFIFWIWIYQVRLLLALFLGFQSFHSLGDFLTVIATTPEGLGFVAVGTLVGAGLTFILFATTVIAMPLLLDRDIDFVTAMIVSFQTVLKNPGPMIGWGVFIAAMTLVAMLPAFLGLIVVLPVLGHATWHLYLAAIEPEAAK